MMREKEKRKRSEDNDETIIASITASKRRTRSIDIDPNPTQTAQKKLTRRDTVHRRVSSSSDHSVIDLEEKMFSPPPKLDEKRRKSAHGRHSMTDSDSSFSLIQENSIYEDSFLEEIRSNEELSVLESESPSISSEVVPVNDPTTTNEEEDIDDDLYSIIIIRTLPPYETVDPFLKRQNLLPPKLDSAPPYTIVLDLDETLVHSVMEPVENYDEAFDIIHNECIESVYAFFRPYLQEFLTEVSKFFEIVVFTASRQCYADTILDIIDPNKTISHRLYREHCLCIEDNYIKDLESLNRDLKTTVIIDNSVYAFGYQLDNGIPIKSWFDDKKDSELRDIIPFLKTLIGKKDVRRVLRSKFKLKSIINNFPLANE